MISSRSTSRVLMCALSIGFASQSFAQEAPVSPCIQKARIAAASFAALSCFLLCTRKSEANFVARGNVREVANVHHAFTTPCAYFTNLKNVYMDHFIGQKGKEAGLQVGANNMIVNKEGCKPTGVLGTIHSKIPGHDETIKIMGMVAAILAVKNPDALLNYFGITKKKDTLGADMLTEAKKQTAAAELQARIAQYHVRQQHPNAPADLTGAVA